MSLLDPSIKDLPVYIMTDILSRLPVKTIIHCKCACKNWRNIVSGSYFANLQHSRSPAGLMIFHNFKEEYHNLEEEKAGCQKTGILRWTEIEDEIDHHHLHQDPVMSIDLNLVPIFQKTRILPVGSVNGLLCLWQYGGGKDNTYICNPVTREYMTLSRKQYYGEGHAVTVCCFGHGCLTREYKVIRILGGGIPPNHTSESRLRLSEAEVYTLGTCKWRSLGRVPYLLKGFYGPFLNGHAHWTVVDKDSPEKICAFDFEMERFELFPSPPSKAIDESRIYKSLGVLQGCLCQCESYDNYWTIWVMKEYGIKKSWHKEFVIKKSMNNDLSFMFSKPFYVIEGLKDGTVLMASYRDILFVYCSQRKTILDLEKFDRYFKGFSYRPSFHRLQHFENERVDVF